MNPLVREWVEKADGDYRTARRERLSRKFPNYDAACFHAQQMAEKYLKAFLQQSDQPIPRTHNLLDLLVLCASIDPTLLLLEEDLKEINGYAVSTRYPGHRAEKPDAVRAVHLAGIIREFIRTRLNLNN